MTRKISHYAVRRCVCHQKTFKELKEISKLEGIESVEELQHRRIAANSCRMCVPYIRQMLKTGETAFEPGSVYKR